MSKALRPEEGRRATREEVCYRCEVSVPHRAPVAGLIVNISPFGCMLRCTESIACGATVAFELPRLGRWQGLVIWSVGGRLGVEFDRDIALEPYLAILGDLRRPGDEMGIY